jgi:flagellar biogenesis protein FliO
MASVQEIQNKNPLIFLIGIIAVGMFLLAKPLQAAFGGGRSTKQLRALARARAAKRRKNRKRKR